jgi:lipid-A-disaccharide synthase
LSPRVLVSCGEASGDLYAGALARALRDRVPDIGIEGLGGPELTRAGGHVIADYRGLSVTGFAEIVTKVPQLRAAKQQLLDAARARRPDVFVAIDYFGFNARLASEIRALGIPVIYYVSPQVWAWRPGRIAVIREIATKMLVIFAFEEAIYRDAGVPVEFVGHPLVDLAHSSRPRDELLRSVRLDERASTIAVLPGSRASEVRRILPTLVDAVADIRASIPAVQLLCARAPHLDDRLFEPFGRLSGAAIVEGDPDAVLAAADLVLTASGTATVQAALHGKPMVVVYRVSELEYRIGRRFVNVDTFAMVNLIAGRRVVPELIQQDFTSPSVATEAVSLLTDPERASRMRADLAEVRRRLGAPGGSRRAADAILETIGVPCDRRS